VHIKYPAHYNASWDINSGNTLTNMELLYMKHKLLTGIIIGAALSLPSIASYAAPITWQLDNVTFASNQTSGTGPFDGTATGSFTYDASTNTYSNVNITTTGSGYWGTDNCGDSALCGTYIRATDLYSTLSATSLQATPTASDPANAIGYYGISMQFAGSGLTNAGGIVDLYTAGGTDGEGICATAACDPTGAGAVSAFRGFSGGSVSAVPIPAAAWLFGSAILGLFGIARRKRA
jgi:hypothetical protein